MKVECLPGSQLFFRDKMKYCIYNQSIANTER